jgi:hypothetical protein
MKKKFKFPLVWLWALVPMLPVFYYALKPAESKRPKVGEVRGGLVYGADGDWHTAAPAWMQGIKEAQPGDELVTERDAYIYQSYEALSAGRRERFKSDAAWKKYHQRWQGKKLLYIPAGRRVRVEYNSGASDDVMVVTPLPYEQGEWYIRHSAFLPE